MRRDMMKRLQALEIRHGSEVGPLAIFLSINDMSRDGEEPEVLGWKENGKGGICVMREPGESAEECGKRAAYLAREQPGRLPGSVPCLLSIVEDADDAS